jgi:hypothetical protein
MLAFWAWLALTTLVSSASFAYDGHSTVAAQGTAAAEQGGLNLF